MPRSDSDIFVFHDSEDSSVYYRGTEAHMVGMILWENPPHGITNPVRVPDEDVPEDEVVQEAPERWLEHE
jgi:hypothetical protein